MAVDRLSVTMDPELGQRGPSRRRRARGTSVSGWLSEAAAARVRNERLGAALRGMGGRGRTAQPRRISSGLAACWASTARTGLRSRQLTWPSCSTRAALIAIDRRSQRARSMLLVIAQHQRGSLCAPAPPSSRRCGATGPVRPTSLACSGTIEVASLDPAAGRRVGELLGRNASADVVDAHLALLVESRRHCPDQRRGRPRRSPCGHPRNPRAARGGMNAQARHAFRQNAFSSRATPTGSS